MLFLVVATIILPGILGCCLPKQMAGNNYETETRVGNHFLIDFDQMKFISRPLVSNGVDFVLSDFSAAKSYVKMLDGTCKTMSLPRSQAYARCLPPNATNGNFYLGPKDALNVQSFKYTIGQNNIVVAVTPIKCIPVISIGTVGTITRTTIYGNVTDAVTDLSDLNQDVSNCVETAG